MLDKTTFESYYQQYHSQSKLPPLTLAGQLIDPFTFYQKPSLSWHPTLTAHALSFINATYIAPIASMEAGLSATSILKELNAQKEVREAELAEKSYTEYKKRDLEAEERIDEKGEQLLSAGYTSRLVLALKSNLNNEIDWALVTLMDLSFNQIFSLLYIPLLLPSLLDLIEPFFDTLVVDSNIGESTLKDGSRIEECFFVNVEDERRYERIMQVLLVLVNVGFNSENSKLMTSEGRLITILERGIGLPSVSRCTSFLILDIQIKHYCLDIFENISPFIQLRSSMEILLISMLQCLQTNDRFLISVSLRCLSNMQSLNNSILAQIDREALRRMLILILVPDEQIVYLVMEFLYLFTKSSNECSRLLVSCTEINVISLLIKYIHWHGFAADVYTKPYKPQTTFVPNFSTEAPPTLDARAHSYFYAAMFLQTIPRDVTYTCSHSDFYDDYMNYCSERNLPSVGLQDLLRLCTSVIGCCFTTTNPPLVIGLRSYKYVDNAHSTTIGKNSVVEQVGKKVEKFEGVSLTSLLVLF